MLNPRTFLARVLVLLAASLALAPAAFASSRLVTVEWLTQNLNSKDLVLIDAQPGQLHAAKHIAGAVNVDVFSFGGRDTLAQEMEGRIQSWGVSPGKKIVIYDQGGTYLATSLVFDLYYHGVPAKDLYVLDGGLAKWQAAGGAVTKDPTPAPAKGTFKVARLAEDARVRLPEFLVATGDPAKHAIVEALDHTYHFGAQKFFDRAGHVPNAISLPTVDFFNADKTFKSPAEIQRMLDYLGVKRDQQVYSHCGGGIAASVPFFAMKFMLDYPKVKLYKESQLEWLRDDRGLPFWTYAAPTQLRDRHWLAGWNDRMMRMFNASRLAIVDVRPADAYKASHVPFALNVPAEVFRKHLNDPAKLAEALAAAGVDPAHEAAIFSAGGVNPDSALAYLALERLGQKKVSVLTESPDDWALGGFAMTKEPTIVGARKSPQDLAVPAVAAYPAAVKRDNLVANAAATKGVYPKVYIASGKAAPAKAPEGKVVHIPYTEFLNADGTPKAAKDIWSVLTKAGVPRYAELVTFADDPGEAAANYFVLKLMGFPDIKVWGA